VYVRANVYSDFLHRLIAKTRALRHGPDVDHNVDIGAISTKGQLDTIASQVTQAVEMGARIVAQSKPVGDVSQGLFYPATVLVDVDHRMRVMREETFGPVVPVMPFTTLDEAVSLANDCTMALTSSVFTSDRALGRRIASQLQSGVVTVNDHLYTHGMTETPWGGWKESGLGRTHGYLGLKEMCNVRCVNEELLPSRWIPRNMWWYPSSPESYHGLLAAVHVVAPPSVASWCRSAFSLVRFAVRTMFTDWMVPTEDDQPPPSEAKKTK
jgi:succinate-semialdehyde dehydrogenase/glutarate-semialdehyde dehydrogenase